VADRLSLLKGDYGVMSQNGDMKASPINSVVNLLYELKHFVSERPTTVDRLPHADGGYNRVSS
jgi:hypothetical protein